MNLLYGMVCEDASSREDGRVDVAGIFHQLYAPGFPAQQDRLVLAMAIEWEESEEGRQEFRIDLTDPTGAPALTIQGHTDVSGWAAGEAPPQTRLVMPLDGVVFPAPGTYRFELLIGGARHTLCPLHLIENPDAV